MDQALYNRYEFFFATRFAIHFATHYATDLEIQLHFKWRFLNKRFQ